MKKLLVRGLIVVVILIIVAVLAVGFFLDGAIKKGVETVGPKIVKVDIKLDSVSLSILSGSGSLKGLVVGNPAGYKTPQAISVGKASLAVSPGSLLSDKIVVRSVRVEAPEITFEGGLKENNLTKILDNVNAAAGGGTEPAAPAEEKAGKKIQVDDFVISGAKVNVSLTGMGGKSVPLVLPDIHLTSLGTGPDGITPADLTQRVFQELVSSTTKAVAASVGELGKEAVDLTKDAGKTATEGVGKATKSVTDLFKKKKE
jgi:uncharacterized protein involved in outer membrane biogenesis